MADHPGDLHNMSMSIAPIDEVDAFARKLYRRAKTSGEDFTQVAATVKSLHSGFKHLRAEAEDPESLLNSSRQAVYSRQLLPILEDCEFALKQLDTILEKYQGRGGNEAQRMDGDKGWIMATPDRAQIELIQSKLDSQMLNIDLFLDTVQLHNPAKSRRVVDTNTANMDSIKDKVDNIAAEICQFSESDLIENEDELWQKFRDGLEKEGFSRDVLRKNQDVLRAYIRQLDMQTMADGGNMPSVRGFLEAYPPPPDTGLQVTPHEDFPLEAPDHYGDAQLMPVEQSRSNRDVVLPPTSYGPIEAQAVMSSDDDRDDSASDTSGAIISTREIMALDKKSADLAIAMGNMTLHPGGQPAINSDTTHTFGSSPPSVHYLPSSSQPALLPPGSPAPGDQSSASTRYTPSLAPPQQNERTLSPLPTLRPNSISDPTVGGATGQQRLLVPPGNQQRFARLAPDSQGREIPLDATWTRIKRSLVSTEVLSQAGVRYEARPDYVAILGSLTREQIIDFARRSAELRASRSNPANGSVSSGSVNMAPNGNAAKRERRPEDRYHPAKYRPECIDIPAGANPDVNGGLYVVHPDGKRRNNSVATQESELYDSSSSDDDYDDRSDDYGRRHRPVPRRRRSRSHSSDVSTEATSQTSRSQPYRHNYASQRSERSGRPRGDSSVSNASHNSTSSRDDEDKGTKGYPYIVPAPKEDSGYDSMRDNKDGPTSSPMPKPILKNKDEEPHVRFNPDPEILEDKHSPSRRREERRDPDRDRERDRERRYRSDRYLDRDRDRERGVERHTERMTHRERDRYERDRERDRDDYYRRHGGSREYFSGANGSRRRAESTSTAQGSGGGRKRSRGDSVRAVGIGGAAASLLSVLAEAAVAW